MLNKLFGLLREAATHKLAQVLYGGAVAALLYGVVDSHLVLLAIALLIGVRGLALATELARKRMTDADWYSRYQALVVECAGLLPEEFTAASEDYGLPRGASVHTLARARAEDERQAYRTPRTGWSVSAECIGMVTYLMLLPATIAFFAFDFVDYRRSQDWRGLLVLVVCGLAYWWPLRWAASPARELRQAWWWSAPLLIVAPLCVHGFTRHPYLDPRAPTVVAADKVLSIENNVTTEHYADWVFRHAQALSVAGKKAEAIAYYRRGLHLAPQTSPARLELARLESREVFDELDARAPYWSSDLPPAALPDCALDTSLSALPSTTVVLVPAGDVATTLLRRVGDVLQRELNIRVCLLTQPMLLPAPTRTRGFVVGQQWDVAALAISFSALLDPAPAGPLKFLVVTNVDIYAEGANFVFSSSYEFGAVLSTARFKVANNDELAQHADVAKQALGAVIKSFGLPASTDPNCVTSYSNGLDQFARKGNRPTAETRALLAARIAEFESTVGLGF